MKQRLLAVGRRVARRLAPALDTFYYRYVFGRPVPFASHLSERFLAWEKRRSKGDVPVSKEVWERQYTRGNWSVLAQLDELSRYMVLVGYLQYVKPGAAVLDVGCGEGLLLRHYRPYGYARYVGIDISETALAKIRHAENEATKFVCANAETYVPTERFDAIVFNGILCYFHDAIGTAARYARALNPDGLLIVSAYAPSLRELASLRALAARYRCLDETTVKNGTKSWVCSVLRARERTNTASEAAAQR